MSKGNKPAGGIGSRVVKQGSVRTGDPARGINPGHVAQQGRALGNHATDAQGKRLNPVEPKFTQSPPSVKLGNEVAKNDGGGGPGAGRTVMTTGSQGQRGAVAGSTKPAGRDILSDFGPDSAGVGGRR